MPQTKVLSDVDNFWRQRYSAGMPLDIAARYRRDNRLQFDLEVISNFLSPSAQVLDLGAGPCIIANEIAPYVSHVTCIEKQALPFEKIKKFQNISCITKDIVEFKEHKKYDLILVFGVVFHLDTDQAKKLYANCYDMMHKDSILIVKSQFGLYEDVLIDKFSTELNAHYQAIYRTLSNEQQLMKDKFICESMDIYPKELNPHTNTKHFHMICKVK